MKTEKIISVLAGQLLREYRTTAGYTVWQLAKKINRSEQQLFRYERGTNKVDLDTLFAALSELSIQPHAFFAQLEDVLADTSNTNTSNANTSNEKDNDQTSVNLQTHCNVKAQIQSTLVDIYT